MYVCMYVCMSPEYAYANRTEIHPPLGWTRPPGRPRQTWLQQTGDGSAKNGTLQSDLDISFIYIAQYWVDVHPIVGDITFHLLISPT